MFNSSAQWQPLSRYPALQKNHIHIWLTTLDCSASSLTTLVDLLDNDEQIRAQRFHFTKDRQSFIASHSLLRQILSNYLAITPKQLTYSYTEFGKPYLKDYPHLQFNLSHSHNAALIGVTLDHALGVDIEYMQRQTDIDAIAERFFSSGEYSILQTLSGPAKSQAFFNGWTRKEAFLKAHGQGLSYSLDKVEVSLLADAPAKLIAIHDEKENISDWSIHAVTTYPDYAAAVAVKNPTAAIEAFTIDPAAILAASTFTQ